MQELRLVAVSEDGSYAVLVVPGRSGRFALPIDERLRTVARGQFSRLAQYEIEVESPLRPKEIQDRIRAGETAEEIADAAGLPIDRIRRYEGPVLAEREYRATEARRATVRGPGEAGLGPRLGEVVTERLADIGTSAEDAEWDSRKRQDSNWQIQLAYTIGGRMYLAEWVYDPRGKHVTPDNDEAIRLSLDEAYWPGPRPAGSAGMTATVTPIGSRAVAAPQHPARAMPTPVTATVAQAQPAIGVSAVSHEQPIGQFGDALGAGEGRVSQRDEEDGQGEHDGAERPQDRDPDPDLNPDPKPEARPVRRATSGRSRRSSVPSWDEIMFGNSRQPD